MKLESLTADEVIGVITQRTLAVWPMPFIVTYTMQVEYNGREIAMPWMIGLN